MARKAPLLWGEKRPALCFGVQPGSAIATGNGFSGGASDGATIFHLVLPPALPWIRQPAVARQPAAGRARGAFADSHRLATL